MCNSKRTPRTQALRQGCPTTSTGFLAGTQAHFKHDSDTEHVSVPFQLTFPEKRAGFPVPCRHIQQHSALLLLEPPSQSPPCRGSGCKAKAPRTRAVSLRAEIHHLKGKHPPFLGFSSGPQGADAVVLIALNRTGTKPP